MTTTTVRQTYVQRMGFADQTELFRMVAAVDMGREGVYDAYFKWLDEDRSKAGLERLLGRVPR